jgi:hypothetical protein
LAYRDTCEISKCLQDVLKISAACRGYAAPMSHTRETSAARRDGQADSETPAFLPEHAFVVQFRGSCDRVEANLAGRVEHVVSGQATHFGSPGELLAFLRAVLRHHPPEP